MKRQCSIIMFLIIHVGVCTAVTADVRSKSLKYMEHGAWFRDDGHGSEHYGISIVQPR